MRDFIYSLMIDKRHGAIFNPLKTILYILSLVYGSIIFARRLLYNAGVFRRNKVPLKVISVGNLTLGGTGKTPFVMALAKILKEKLGREVSILIRGYGWDEQAMLRKCLPELPVFVGEDRVKAARRAVKLYGSDTVVLDDGFQYWELERDLDIVLVDSRKPFGNGQLFPRGILREPKEAIARADMVVFTKVNKRLADIEEIKKGLKDIKDNLVFAEAIHKPVFIYDFKTKKISDLGTISSKKAILLSSIGDPGYFEETAKDLAVNILGHIIFSDHHNYVKKDIEKITGICDEKNFDFLLTTEKDAVKLTRLGLSVGGYALKILALEVDIVSGKEDLVARLNSLYNG